MQGISWFPSNKLTNSFNNTILKRQFLTVAKYEMHIVAYILGNFKLPFFKSSVLLKLVIQKHAKIFAIICVMIFYMLHVLTQTANILS